MSNMVEKLSADYKKRVEKKEKKEKKKKIKKRITL
jgi:hypothetical protein